MNHTDKTYIKQQAVNRSPRMNTFNKHAFYDETNQNLPNI